VGHGPAQVDRTSQAPTRGEGRRGLHNPAVLREARSVGRSRPTLTRLPATEGGLMDPGHKRIRVVVGDHELELEGDDAFIAEHAESLQGLLDALRTTPISPAGGGDGKKGPKITPLSGVSESEFGEQLLSMP